MGVAEKDEFAPKIPAGFGAEVVVVVVAVVVVVVPGVGVGFAICPNNGVEEVGTPNKVEVPAPAPAVTGVTAAFGSSGLEAPNNMEPEVEAGAGALAVGLKDHAGVGAEVAVVVVPKLNPLDGVANVGLKMGGGGAETLLKIPWPEDLGPSGDICIASELPFVGLVIGAEPKILVGGLLFCPNMFGPADWLKRGADVVGVAPNNGVLVDVEPCPKNPPVPFG